MRRTVRMPASRTSLLILDDDEDLRHAVADLVELDCARHVIGVAGLDELAALGPRALECGMCIIDVNLGTGKPGGVDALEWLRQHGYRGKVVFLTGHGRTSPQVERAHQVEGVPVLSKPVSMATLMNLVASVP